MTNEELADNENAAGMAHVRAGRMVDAITHFQRASRLVPDDELIRNNLGAALVEIGRFEDALKLFDDALSRNRDYPEAHHNRAVALRGLSRIDEAIQASSEAVRLRPDHAEAQLVLGMSLFDQGRFEEARIACRRAKALQPNSAHASLFLGRIASRFGHLTRALEHFGNAISLDPALDEPHLRAGYVLSRLGRRDEAIACFERASQAPDYRAEAFERLGDAQSTKSLRSAAIESFGEALKIEPQRSFARSQRLFLMASLCRWADIEREVEHVPTLGIHGAPASPFAMLAFEDAPERHRIRSLRFAAHYFPQVVAPSAPAVDNDSTRMRIGYFSADFYEHATAFLAARLFELHDRSRFEVHAFSYRQMPDDPMVERLRGTFHAFHDISTSSDESAASLAREKGIDIAIDLKGYTEEQRLGIFAHRAAPIQISFLGYPGTTGASFMDYLVADPIVIPNEERQNYSEKLIVMPNCYQPTDNSRAIGLVPTREAAGLPEFGFVFCAFNQSWKISRQEFDIWARLLKAVEGSVLWLLRCGEEPERNLKSEMANRGVDSKRLIFAPFVPQSQHLARLALADLFLDTFRYGAHTTASDALWAGVPIITSPGRGFATRVACSLLHAIGMPELVTNSREAYEQLATELATDVRRLHLIRDKLHRNREVKPLFDSAAFTRAFERGLETAQQHLLRGETSVDIRIDPES